MKSEGKSGSFKESLNEKVHSKFVYVVLIIAIVLLILSIVLGCIVWFAPKKVIETIIPSHESDNKNDPSSDITDPVAVSRFLTSLEPTAKEWTKVDEDQSMNGIYFITNDGSACAVYNVDMNALTENNHPYTKFDHIWVDSDSNDFYTVINIAGKKVDLSGYYVLVRNDSDDFAKCAIFNCYEAEEVNLGNAIFTGTLLAPYAKIKYENSFVYGQVYSSSAEGKPSYSVDIAFTGLDYLADNLVPINFETRGVREAVIAALKTEEPDKYYNYTYDSVIYAADLKKITALDLSCLAIVTVGNDLQYFNHIKSLNLRNSSIRHIDFTKFDSLVSLDLSYSAVDFTDLSLFPDLQTLSIAGKSPFDYDFSKVPKLVYLDVSDCGLSDSGLDKLLKIYPGLTSLIINDNPGITSLDLSSYPNMQQLGVSGCSLGALDLAPCKEHLTYLKCSDCGIKELDISDCPRLTTVEAYGFKKIDITGTMLLSQKNFLRDETTEITGPERPVEEQPEEKQPEEKDSSNTQQRKR